ncbi:phosphate signaling complex protein PhoU [Halocella sp. SP3-1]|uniref:phosphate signaling complex protein PhoU n=1 Tax=Halocella sp. SP3-1 TaxID=2382161 RepID=UPI000F750FB2|nr:phosphate signaling complex protein PhoU [Halocella sp. SP3-1]AZO93214.1 phosphate transport system regulatory protein PhoU [Halocella sp. SP3-1]MTI59827.1 phosphate signaling complex protein PhoU [Bacillota bacterium]
MRKSFHESIKEIKKDLLKMGSMVEMAIHKSIESLKEGDLEMAANVIKKDDKIDDFETALEEKCTKLIALQQPVASDLRVIIVISKLVTDLERIGDYASNIANQVLDIADEPLVKPLIDIPRMTEIVTRRLRESLDAFINMDIEQAKRVAREDEEIDVLDKQIMRELITFMLEDPSTIKQATSLMFISRFLERIGDHSTNVCERVIYMVSGVRENY